MNFLAHRVIPQVFVQEVKITSMRNGDNEIELTMPQVSEWTSAETKNLKWVSRIDYQNWS